MARKHRRREKRARQRRQQQQHRPAQRLRDAAAALRSGNPADALSLVEGAFAAANDPATEAASWRLMVEAHFRLAAATTSDRQRLDHLDAAIELDPEAFRLRYHRAVTLCRLGRVAEAAPAFEALAAQDASRRDVVTLGQLARAAMGQSGANDAAEATTPDVDALQAVLNGVESRTQTSDGPSRDDTAVLWQTLRRMMEQPKAAPVAQLRALADGLEPTGGAGAVAQYYLGVAAMRAGDVETGRAAWQAAAEAGMVTPWSDANHAHLLREQAHALGQEGRWQTLVDLSQSHSWPASPDPAVADLIAVAHTHLGHAAARANDWTTAGHHWQEAASRNTARRLLQNLALADEALGNWSAAAATWRQVVRRRPRKQDHPDALTDAQVAALWHHVVECYEHADEMDEALACLRTALKYAPEDLELRLKAADIAMQMERETVAENELDRLLSINPQHLPALERLASLYTDNWNRDPIPVWRRVLAIEPQHEEAREAIARWYVEDIEEEAFRYGLLGPRTRRSRKKKIARLEEGLKELPGHPSLLVELGKQHAASNQQARARSYLEQAWEAAPQKVGIVGEAMHELLHVGGGDIVTRLLPTARQIRGLLAAFWVDQGSSALQSELGQEWVDLFWQEAQDLGQQRRHGDTPAYVLVKIFDAANAAKAPDVAAHYEARLRAEHPNSGAVDYVEAYHTAHDRDDPDRAIRLLRKVRQTARRAGEESIADLAEEIITLLTTPFDPLAGLLKLFGGAEEDAFDESRRRW